VTVFTIGHATRSLDELAGALRAYGVTTLVDIRTIPRSRTNPQFNADAIGPALAQAGIRYVRLPALGGLRGKLRGGGPSANAAWEHASFRNYADYATSPAFREGLSELEAIAARAPTAIMCAEMLWWRCHRRIVADHLLACGVDVVHVFTETHAEPATLTPFAVVGNDGVVRYPAAS
jgi:uncharacterized protein (DUF488 family)